MSKDKDILDKRMHLVSRDAQKDVQFEVHVQKHVINETVIVFFAVTHPKFGQGFTASDLLDDFKRGFLNLHDSDTIRNAKAKVIKKKSVAKLGEILKKYSVSKLSQVEDQVNEVAKIMEDSIRQQL